MEIDPQTLRSVWWKGAIGGALKGIPQGLMLGALGAVGVFVGIAALGAVAPTLAAGLAADFASFLYAGTPAVAASLAAGSVPAFSLASLNILPIVALNTVLTSVGNFLTGGQIACNAYKQDAEHRINAARISQLEARTAEKNPTTSPTIASIIARGPRAQVSHETAEASRQSEAAQGPTIH